MKKSINELFNFCFFFNLKIQILKKAIKLSICVYRRALKFTVNIYKPNLMRYMTSI